MYILKVMFAAMLVGSGIALQMINTQARVADNISAEVLAANFLSYRKSIIDFKSTHPDFNLAPVTLAQYRPYLPLGAITPSSDLHNIHDIHSQLSIWYTGNISKGSAYLIHDRLGGSPFVGFKNSSGTLRILKNRTTIDTGIVLPGVIPDNAFVVYGE